MEAICEANNRFGLDLMKELNTDESVVLGSFSLMTALAMLYLGARGKSASQIKKTLHLENIEDVHSGFKEVLAAMNGSTDYTLFIANRFFGDHSFNFNQKFLQDSAQFYNSDVQKENFKQNPKSARQNINKWVDEQTRGKITDLLPQDSITDLTKLVMVNAMYFLANWTRPFSEHRTYNASFTLSTNEKVNVQMMYMGSSFNYRKTSMNGQNVQILELPYGKDRNMSMIIILPEHNNGLSELVERLTYETIANWTNSENMKRIYVNVHLPKFHVKSKAPVTEALKGLGMIAPFTQYANLSGISNDNLLVSGLYHQAYVSIDESGTEAAAATAIAIEITSAIYPQAKFNASHPFLFLIKHKTTNCIIFQGKCLSP